MAKRKVRQARHRAEAPKQREQPVVEAEGRAEGPESAAPAVAPARSRGKLAGVAVALVVFVAAIVGVAVFAAGGGDESGYMDGVVVASDEERLVLRLPEPVDGQEQVEMEIPPEYRETTVNIEHLQYHQVQGDIFRIHYEQVDGEYQAVLAEDIPGVSHGPIG